MAFPFIPPFGLPPSGGIPDPSRFVPQGNPFAELETILNNLQNRAPIAPPQQNLAQRILNPLAEGAAILASPDSGGALGNILQQRKKREDDYTKMNAEIQNNLMMVKLQTAIERAKALSTEQAQARQEQRQNIYDTQKGQREVKEYGQKKQIDLKTAEDEFRTQQKLLAEYEPAITAREKNKAMIQDWPKQRVDSLEWQAMAKTVMPNLDPMLAETIGDKLSKLNREPLTIEENDLVKKVNQEFAKQFQEERKAKIGKIKAETFRETQEGLYAQRNKPGSSAFQDRFANNYNATLGANAGKRIANFYYRIPATPNAPERILTDTEYNSLDITSPDKFTAVPMIPEENDRQRSIEAKKFVDAQTIIKQQQQQNNNQQNPSTEGIPQKLLDTLELGKQRNRTDEQLRIMLKANGATQEQINKLVPPSPQSQTKANEVPKTKFERAMESLGKGFKLNQ